MYASVNIIKVVKSRRMIWVGYAARMVWAGYAARMGEARNA
jgi:hypothetical protein